MTTGTASGGVALRLTLAALVLYLVLVQPNHPGALTWGALLAFPLEWPAVLAGLVVAGAGRGGRALRLALVAGLTVIAVQKSADLAMFTALNRGFNVVGDTVLVTAGLHLLTEAVGPALTVLAGVGAVLAVVGLVAALWWATGVWTRARAPAVWRRGAAALAVLAAGLVTADIAQRMGAISLPAPVFAAFPGTAFTARVGIETVRTAQATLQDLRAFRAAAAADPYADRAGLLDRIDRDVIVVFIESYGRTSLDTPFYADLHRATLAAGQADLTARGLAMASGVLVSPTQGGQSWLAHATFANGLRVSGQTRYRAVLASGRQTLFHVAARAGFHTAAVMPLIILDWPESSVMGFDTVLPARDMGYQGDSFNWIPVPDQFAFLAMDRLVRQPDANGRHRFIQLATGSSHAPWLPVPTLLDWDSIGDGRIFNPMAAAGDPAEVVWRDHDRVRAQYRLAVDYALQVILSYAARHADDPPLMIVVGDHQAAGFVALDDRPDVPIHVIGPAHLVDRAAADWGLDPGLIPRSDAPAVPMEVMRDRMLDTFSTFAAED